MRKYLLLLGMATTCGIASADTLYQSTFNTEEEVAGWTIIDANADESTWKFSAMADEGSRFYYTYNGSNAGDDWAISPAITPTADGKLLVTYSVAGSYYSEALKVYYGSAPTVEVLSANLVADYPALSSSTQGSYFIVDAVAGQPVYIGFYACTPADRWRLYLKSLSVSALDGDPADIALSEIVSPVTGENLGQESVQILVKNVGEAEVSGFTASYTVDGGATVTEVVEHTLAAGEEYVYTFSTPADLSEPYKLYTLKATVSNDSDVDSSNNSAQTTVRHYADQVEPYSMGFESSEDTSRLKYFNLNEDDGDWDIYVGSWYMNLARTGNNCLAYNYDKEHNGDDWAILEPIRVQAGYHALKFWYSGGDNHVEKLRVAYGTAPTPEAMTTTIVDYPSITQGEYVESINLFEIAQDTTIYIGFYAYSDKDENWLTIDDVTLESFDPSTADVSVSNFTSLGAYVPTADYKRVTFDLYNMSLNTADVTVKVAVDGEVVATRTETLTAQQSRTVTYEGLLDAVSVGTHTISVTTECDIDNNTENNTVSVEARFLGTPDIIYDFEDGKVPATFQYFVNDSGTLNESAIEEFGENGWGVTQIEQHTLYGQYMLTGSTWVDFSEDSYSTTLNRLLVLPEIQVDSTDACFVWNVGSMNESYPVSYRVMANDGYWGDDISNSWYYDYLKSVENQGTTRVNEGVSLGSYAGKKVYVAIQLNGTSGDAVAFDNLQFHGCSPLTTTAISSVKSEYAVRGVKVYDLSGKLVASGSEVAPVLQTLSHGMYVVRTTSDGASRAFKVVK